MMTPPRASSAEFDAGRVPLSAAEMVARMETFFAAHTGARVLQDGKLVFDLAVAKYSIKVEEPQCQLQMWDETRHMARNVVAVEERGGVLRISTARLGQSQTKLLQVLPARRAVVRGERDVLRSNARTGYTKLLERVLARQFPDWQPESFRSAMDLEKSFGPAYTRGWLARGNHAWAVIGVNAEESPATIDDVLTVGILWLHHLREHGAGRRQFTGLKVVVPQGCGMLTASRMAWLNTDAARWELWELDAATGEMMERDPDDQGNLRTRLVHHADEAAAGERFAEAVAQVMALVREPDHERVERRLRGPAEMAFCLHGLEFARARWVSGGNSFRAVMEITFGAKGDALSLEASTRAEIEARVRELFARRQAGESAAFARRAGGNAMQARRIGAPSTQPAHAKVQGRVRPVAGQRPAQNDPLYRAAPERWLESMLRKDLTTLTRGLAPGKAASRFGDDIGNRAEPVAERSSVIPRLDARHVYTQVPAIAGASDRGMLDLLGVTADGRLAVIELKAEEDMHFALQGLDYWVRVRHHHLQPGDAASGLGELQRHGYFRDVELAALAPRLYLVAPALRIHPATEIVLRYFSRRVEWNLLALDERWRSQIKVVWRRQGGRS